MSEKEQVQHLCAEIDALINRFLSKCEIGSASVIRRPIHETELEGKLWAELQTAHANNRELERANAALRVTINDLTTKVSNQTDGIRYLEGVANHADRHYQSGLSRDSMTHYISRLIMAGCKKPN